MGAAQEIFDIVRAGDTTRLKALLASEPGLVNARNERGHSPVLIAQYHHKKEAVAVLLAAGPDLDVFDAASVGDTDRVAALLDQDPSQVNAYSADGFYPLGLAAFFGHPDTVALLVARGADLAQVARNPMRVQPLNAAVAGRSLDVVRILVEAGAPIDPQQQEGWTPLHGAVHQGNVELAQYLLDRGANPRLQNDKGKNAFGLAADAGNLAMLKLLKGQA
jgi:ankyrin repeat protein